MNILSRLWAFFVCHRPRVKSSFLAFCGGSGQGSETAKVAEVAKVNRGSEKTAEKRTLRFEKHGVAGKPLVESRGVADDRFQ